MTAPALPLRVIAPVLLLVLPSVAVLGSASVLMMVVLGVTVTVSVAAPMFESTIVTPANGLTGAVLVVVWLVSAAGTVIVDAEGAPLPTIGGLEAEVTTDVPLFVTAPVVTTELMSNSVKPVTTGPPDVSLLGVNTRLSSSAVIAPALAEASV